MNWTISYAAAAGVFFALDLLWLGRIAKGFYRRRLGHLLAPRFRAGPAVLFYGLYVAGILYFAVEPGAPLHAAARDGALFGFFCYATYNLTNYATLRDWPPLLVVVDTGWGTCVTALAAITGALAVS
ncbi:MAG: DUF2177 family protein [Rhodospirillaceae bacterium]